jgi:hypothetical protein
MFRTFVIAAALALAAGAAQAQKIDKNGRCHDAAGKFAKMEVCKSAAPAKPEHCRDAKSGKFAKCGAAGAVAVPAKK